MALAPHVALVLGSTLVVASVAMELAAPSIPRAGAARTISTAKGGQRTLSATGYCGYPDVQDPWSTPLQVCGSTAFTEETCTNDAYYNAVTSCYWSPAGFCSSAALEAGDFDPICGDIHDQPDCDKASFVSTRRCVWYDPPAPTPPPIPDAYCGYPDDDHPWDSPIQVCGTNAFTEELCLTNAYYDTVTACYWTAMGLCSSAASEAGDYDPVCPGVSTQSLCESLSFYGSRRCVWHVPPTPLPSFQPSSLPSFVPTTIPSVSLVPTSAPSRNPSSLPSIPPSSSMIPTTGPSKSISPTDGPSTSVAPTYIPSFSYKPSTVPSASIVPTDSPSRSLAPTVGPTTSLEPTWTPTASSMPSSLPTSSDAPSQVPSSSVGPTDRPSSSAVPSTPPSSSPVPSTAPSSSLVPSTAPSLSQAPTLFPTSSINPTSAPSSSSLDPSAFPTDTPSTTPSGFPSTTPSVQPSMDPSDSPSSSPTVTPSAQPSRTPSGSPSSTPTKAPTGGPTSAPTPTPSGSPSSPPTPPPTFHPTTRPTYRPTKPPSKPPTRRPSPNPSKRPTRAPTPAPTNRPTTHPSSSPTQSPSRTPSVSPSYRPSLVPTESPSQVPSALPQTAVPSELPSSAPSQTPTGQPSPAPSWPPINATIETCLCDLRQCLEDKVIEVGSTIGICLVAGVSPTTERLLEVEEAVLLQPPHGKFVVRHGMVQSSDSSVTPSSTNEIRIVTVVSPFFETGRNVLVEGQVRVGRSEDLLVHGSEEKEVETTLASFEVSFLLVSKNPDGVVSDPQEGRDSDIDDPVGEHDFVDEDDDDINILWIILALACVAIGFGFAYVIVRHHQNQSFLITDQNTQGSAATQHQGE